MQYQFYAFAFLLIGVGVGLLAKEVVPCVYVGLGIFSVGCSFFIFLIVSGIILGRPNINLDLRKIIRFNPSRTILELRISNKKLRGLWEYVCIRKSINCWLEVGFIVDDGIPQLNNTEASADWWDKPPHRLLESNSGIHEIELISKIHGERGFHIKKPKPETLMIAEDVVAVILIKSGIEVVKKATWIIFDKGIKGQDLDFERLE